MRESVSAAAGASSARVRAYRFALCGAVLFPVVAFASFWALLEMNPGTKLWCRYEDIDVNSGRVRQQRYVLYRLISERVEKNAFSREGAEIIGETGPPVWVHGTTFSPGSSGLHTRYGGVPAIFYMFSLWLEDARPGRAKREEVVREILTLLQSGKPGEAREYLSEVLAEYYKSLEEVDSR